MPHPNEELLRRLYALFAQGDLPGFLDGCTDDVTFTVPGPNQITRGQPSAVFTKSTFGDMIAPVMQLSAGTFREDVEDVFANDEHGVLLLLHRLDRSGTPVQYRPAHIIQFRDGRIASWREHPGDDAGFAAAWT